VACAANGSRSQTATGGCPLATLNLKDYEDFKQPHDLRILGAE
jgi:hypothetical protein